MRNSLIFPLITLLTAAVASADPIHYDQIPADVTGYFHFDIERFLSSPLSDLGNSRAMMMQQADALMGTHTGITIYTTKSGGPGGFVFLMHTSNAEVVRRLLGNIADAKNAVTFSYQNQDVHFAPESWESVLAGARMNGLTSATTQPDQQRQNLLEERERLAQERARLAQDQEKLAQEQEKLAGESLQSEKKPSGFVSVGLGSNEMMENFNKGPAYTAVVGQDCIIIAGDLPSMANALDVIQGRKPSLAHQDPQGLKIKPPPGVMFLGAGLTAQISKENAGSTTQPAAATDLGHGGGFGLDMFGSFKANARLAQLDMGEDGQNLYVDGLVSMKDADSAEQLKNLALGVKALISLTQTDSKPLIDPLEVKLDDSNVVLHWSWPTAKLGELFRLARSRKNHGHSVPPVASEPNP
jgi:hypothetical protein